MLIYIQIVFFQSLLFLNLLMCELLFKVYIMGIQGAIRHSIKNILNIYNKKEKENTKNDIQNS